MSESLLRVENLKKWFPVGGGIFTPPKHYVKAVDDVSFQVQMGETFGIVGESGCGKSTLGRTILHLLEPTDGKIFFQDRDVARVKHKDLQKLRRDLQIIFQDPYASLNPRMNVGKIVQEPLLVHCIGSPKEREEKVEYMLETVGLNKESIKKYPHEFSGGQRQRIGIARALVLNPKLIVCDEPVSALDVSIQSQILNLLNDLQGKFKLTYIFISHDLSVVNYISDRIAVMYLGKIVELAQKNDLFDTPLHPYTKALLSAIPHAEIDKERKRIVLQGDVPSPIDPPSGCHFRTRCEYAYDKCAMNAPELQEIASGHFVACNKIN
ncbi:MAG: peptide/nickel transport system ATP-binding protein [Clostridia bacterium]|nr:peptide/nickel transport system ATP-binding protein [Clostridia bacterium]